MYTPNELNVEIILARQPELDYNGTNPKRVGRPRRSPTKKVSYLYKFLTTAQVERLIKNFADSHDITITGVGRLMLYTFLIVSNIMSKELLEDGTFEEMRNELSNSPELGALISQYSGKEFIDQLFNFYHKE